MERQGSRVHLDEQGLTRRDTVLKDLNDAVGDVLYYNNKLRMVIAKHVVMHPEKLSAEDRHNLDVAHILRVRITEALSLAMNMMPGKLEELMMQMYEEARMEAGCSDTLS
jgi:hypothetical protein